MRLVLYKASLLLPDIVKFMPLFYSNSSEQTQAIAKKLAKKVRPGTVFCFFGDLGTGKTTFVKALAQALGCSSEELVNSPTFQYLNIYKGSLPIYHFDLYRLKSEEDFIHLGFDEFLHSDGISCIEWAEKIESLIPASAICIRLAHAGNDQRTIEISEEI